MEPLLTATTNQVASQLEEQLFSSELFSYSHIIMDSKSIIIIIWTLFNTKTNKKLVICASDLPYSELNSNWFHEYYVGT